MKRKHVEEPLFIEDNRVETGSIKPRKIKPQNIVNRLIARETFGYFKPGTHFHVARQFYQNVFPNFTIINVEKPPCFLRKFSPDGRYCIAFSSDQTSLEIYWYKGPGAAGDLLYGIPGDVSSSKKSILEEGSTLRSKVFDRFFKVSRSTG